MAPPGARLPGGRHAQSRSRTAGIRLKLSHLPNRRVRLEASEERLAFRTATELLEVAWSEQKALRRRPTFWIFCLKSGARIPVPAQLVSQQDAAFFTARLEAPVRHGPDA